MSVLELSFGARTVSLELGEPLSSVRPKLSGLPHDIGEFDAELERRYVTMAELGVDLLFQPDRLSCVFLHVKSPEGGYERFKGRVSLLPDDFFEHPGRDRLVAALQQAGFAIWPKPYPHAVDLVSAKLRVRYTDAPRGCHITIDDGSLLRRNLN